MISRILGYHTGDFVIADLDYLLKKRNAVKPGYDQVKQVFLQLEESVDIKSLSGFKKGHRVPDNINSATQSFVGNIAQQEVRRDVQVVKQPKREPVCWLRAAKCLKQVNSFCKLQSEAAWTLRPRFAANYIKFVLNGS